MTDETLAVGDVVASGVLPIDRDDLVRYAGASGDFNPIHYRDDVATAVGLPGVLAHGMLTMGLAVQPVVARFGGDRVLEYGVRFTRPVPVPLEGEVLLEVEAKVGLLDEEAGEARIDLVAKVAGQTVLGRAQVRVALHPRPAGDPRAR
ncbi:MaoC/PaaZ C-terminal domain-containing protein [uncultured Amnibacterium sp.]|uniref:MaoC/PaaZ C-terminal domain-containing protein n=1 Tax=uncultured Amnibacterium sp. TaxID=1631851 RepID=UPI0035CA4682